MLSVHVPLCSQGFGEHLSENVVNIYHPQSSCGKVMFSQASAILFTGLGGVYLEGCGRHPPRQTPQWADIPPKADIPGQTPPRQTPLGRHPPTQCMLGNMSFEYITSNYHQIWLIN